MITFASASLLGCEIHTDLADRPTRHLRYGSDAWARNNERYESAKCANDVLPRSVYFAELERSWSTERFNTITTKDDASRHEYQGTSYSTRDDSIAFNNADDHYGMMNGLAEAEEMPIAHSILNHMFGTSGYKGSRNIYNDVRTTRARKLANLEYSKESKGFVSTARIHRTRKVMGPNYGFVILSRNK